MARGSREGDYFFLSLVAPFFLAIPRTSGDEGQTVSVEVAERQPFRRHSLLARFFLSFRSFRDGFSILAASPLRTSRCFGSKFMLSLLS